MDEEATSWVRRTKFSHTVYHRLDTSNLVSVPLNFQREMHPKLKSRPEKLSHSRSQIERNPLTNKQRSVSPLPETVLPETFKEAPYEKKRFSTPHSRREVPEKKITSKLFHNNQKDKESKGQWHGSKSKSTPNTSPLRHFGSSDKSTYRKESWTRYFDPGSGRVTAVEAADEHMIDLSQLFLGLRFAHGANSRLYHGIYKEEPVAVKIIKAPDDDENGILADRLEGQFNREVTLLSRLRHPNIIKFVAACRKPPVFCIVTEYLSGGSLRAYLHKLEHQTLPIDKLINIALEIARGMEFVHSQGVIHRDLKPENVLIDEDFHMKVADFGIACEEENCDPFADDPGTYRWMAPEMIKHKPYGRKVDVYSFGLILWEMVSGSIPYEDMTPIQAAFAVINKNMRPAFPVDCPPAMQALIEQCWSSHLDKRPEFWQVVQVLEQFESSLAVDGNLELAQNITCQDHKKGLFHWIQKLSPTHANAMPKPRFS